MPVPEGVKNIGLLNSTEFLRPKEIEPGQLAAVYVKQLEQHPHDSEVREKLAQIYAHDFQRLDLATMELAQLINEPRHSPKQIAHWLTCWPIFRWSLARTWKPWRPRWKKSWRSSRIRPWPNRRNAGARINLEFKGKTETPGVKLGVYEQNIGLKYGAPRKS